MSATAIETVVRMMEALPEPAQDQLVEHLREYLADFQDEFDWDEAFRRTQAPLAAAAQRAKREIDAGLAQPLDLDDL